MSLEERRWSPALADRLAHHLHYMEQITRVYLVGSPPSAAPPPPADAAAAVDALDQRIRALLDALDQSPDARLHAPVLDPHERALTVLGHLYDLCRTSARLVEWLGRPDPPPPEDVLAALVGDD